MVKNFRELFRFKELLWKWTLREIRVRYKQSFLGGAWAILQPLSLMIIFTLVFSIIASVPTEGVPYPIFAYTALLPWMFFATSISFASTSLINNLNLITKVYFPREILPLGNIWAAFFDFLIASIVLIAMMIVYNIQFTITILWLPLLLIIQILLMIGISFVASVSIAYYRDLRFVIPLLLQLWLYATPVIYPISLVPDWLLPFYMLNPMAALIVSYRRVILLGLNPQWLYLAPGIIISILVFIVGFTYFNRVEPKLADII